ncbi:MAG: DUF2169 domain-containing protein [Holophagales bacterium]|nr:DUF2169 domain-containing protein [Holophagales bacterium]
MRLENETALSAHLFSGAAGESDLGCALVVKATFDIREESLELSTESPWPIHLEPFPTSWGTFPGEIAPRKPKTDVIVLGRAMAPAGDPVRSMTVSVSVGPFRHSLAVFGDRYWERGAGGLRVTEPVPFREMPVTWTNAFGGKVRTPVGEWPNTDNPEGKGFLMDEADAEGVPLPNVEDPKALIRSPKDLPKPVGWGPYPLAGGVRVAKLRGPDGAALPFEAVEPWVMGWAHPDLIVETPAAGTPVVVEGMTRGGPIAAAVPAFPARVVLLTGDERRTLVPKLDTLIVETERKRLVVRWRAAETFEMRPREVRLVRIEAV